MAHTYTYTARDAVHPDTVVTFTLTDHQMKVNLTGVVEKVQEVTESEQKGSEAFEQMKSVAVPGALLMLERISGPYHLDDAYANAEGDSLNVGAWYRLAGLRLAPIQISINHVDNPDAAHDFVKEFNERKASAPSMSTLSGVLDYWGTWVGMVAAAWLLLRMRRRT